MPICSHRSDSDNSADVLPPALLGIFRDCKPIPRASMFLRCSRRRSSVRAWQANSLNAVFQPHGRLPHMLGGWRVDDATGRPLAYVYGSDQPKGASDDGLSLDEARRIAAGIARLPELLS